MYLYEISKTFQLAPNKKIEKYLSEFVYGGIDGCVTTFAVVAGAVGASLDTGIIIILGFANLLADGFAMSIGAYLSAKSDLDNFNKYKQREYWEIENLHAEEVKEIRDIYESKGFEGELLDKVVNVITSDKDRWVDVMMKEELKMIKNEKSPQLIGLATFISFCLVGIIPLSTYLVHFIHPLSINLFFLSSILTAIGFAIIGAMKAVVNETTVWKGIAETLILGIVAAAVAYFVGDLLEKWIS
ncbi:MAG: hypothetical protein HKN09_10960 [Saprospiraceae bacterium]|nr:hypothetical protein [Saprospiraceae bacterium]